MSIAGSKNIKFFIYYPVDAPHGFPTLTTIKNLFSTDEKKATRYRVHLAAFSGTNHKTLVIFHENPTKKPAECEKMLLHFPKRAFIMWVQSGEKWGKVLYLPAQSQERGPPA